jgi:hypothetical protein
VQTKKEIEKSEILIKFFASASDKNKKPNIDLCETFGELTDFLSLYMVLKVSILMTN